MSNMPPPPPPVGSDGPSSSSSPPPPVGYDVPPGAQPLEPNPENRTMAMLCHVLGIFTGFIGPLLVWLLKKDQSPFINYHGKEALNFAITSLLLMIVVGLVTCGFGAPVVAIVMIVFLVIAGLAANRGEWYRYPFSLRLIK